MARPRHRFSAHLIVVLVAAVATLFAGPVEPASAAPVPALPPSGSLCTTDQWRNPSNFQTCVDKLANLAGDRASCVKSPTPSAPDSGLAGWFATRPEAYDKPGFKGQYTRYGYAGYDFTTYDIGCVPTVMHPDYKFENTVANGEMMTATAIVGMSNALRERAWNPLEMWGWADPLVEHSTKAVYDKVFTVFGAVTLAIVGMYLIWRSKQSDMSNAMTTAGWAVLVMVVVTAIAQWPSWSASVADNTLISSLSVVHEAVGPGSQEIPADQCVFDAADCADNREPALRASDTAVEGMVYRNWLRGALGSADSETAKKYGPVLFDAKAFTWGEREDIRRDPSQRQVIIDQKALRWQKVAEQIKAEDPEAYEYLQGMRSMDRIGSGFIAILSAIFFGLFDIMASVLVLLGFLIFRWAVIAAPILGTLGLLRPASAGLRRLANVVIAAIFNIVIFGTGAAIYLAATDLIMSTASLPGWLQVVLICLTGVVGWILLRPYRRITQLGGKSVTEGFGASGGWHRLFLKDLRAAASLRTVDETGGTQSILARGRGADPRHRPETRGEEITVIGGTPVQAGAGSPPVAEPGTPGRTPRPEQASPVAEPVVVGAAPTAAAAGQSPAEAGGDTAEQRHRPRNTMDWEVSDLPGDVPSYTVYRPGSEPAETPNRTTRRPESLSLPG